MVCGLRSAVYSLLDDPSKEAGERYFLKLSFFIFKNVDGTQFSPDVSKEDTLYIFSPETCRYALLSLGKVHLI